MKLSDHDLRQIDEERINKLSETAVKNLSITLLNDLKEARERLNQNSKNSSIPPSSDAPWDIASKFEDEALAIQIDSGIFIFGKFDLVFLISL